MVIENVCFVVGSCQWDLRKDVKIPLLDHKEVTSFGALSLYHRILVWTWKKYISGLHKSSSWLQNRSGLGGNRRSEFVLGSCCSCLDITRKEIFYKSVWLQKECFFFFIYFGLFRDVTFTVISLFTCQWAQNVLVFVSHRVAWHSIRVLSFSLFFLQNIMINFHRHV